MRAIAQAIEDARAFEEFQRKLREPMKPAIVAQRNETRKQRRARLREEAKKAKQS